MFLCLAGFFIFFFHIALPVELLRRNSPATVFAFDRCLAGASHLCCTTTAHSRAEHAALQGWSVRKEHEPRAPAGIHAMDVPSQLRRQIMLPVHCPSVLMR